jgi:adenosine kinase
MSFLVTGSIAYDNIMTFNGRFKDHIMPDKIHILNVSFLLEEFRQNFGGTAGNIAYNLNLIEEKSVLLAAVGNDFQIYKDHLLQQKWVSLAGIKEFADIKTACCYITTDLDDNQITAFYPGAMNRSVEIDISDLSNLQDIDLAIISPDSPSGMKKHAKECRELNIPYILDVGQQIIAFDRDELLELLSGAKVLIGNDYEITLFCQKVGKDAKALVEIAEMVITTKGEQGSEIQQKEGVISIPSVKVKAVADPTGAGDAYRAGIMVALKMQIPLEQGARMAALLSAYAIEEYGTQNHRFSMSEFRERYEENFGQPCPK